MKTIPVIKVDLTLSAQKRWAHLPAAMRKSAKTLANNAGDTFSNARSRSLGARIMDATTLARNPYRQEMLAVARLCDIPKRDALLANFAYEIAQLDQYPIDQLAKMASRFESEWKDIRNTPKQSADIRNSSKKSPVMGCTTGAAYYEKLGMIHLRTLDWSVKGLGRHTVITHFSGAEAGDFYSVGWPGFVGVLSGMAPGRFSATINQAPPFGNPALQWPPSHLLRSLFETCETYDLALKALLDTPVCVPAFVTLVGIKAGEAAIVEMTPERNVAHPMRQQKPIAIANDYLSGKMRQECGLSSRTVSPGRKGLVSESRRNALLEIMNQRKPATLPRLFSMLEQEEIETAATAQQMVFLPAKGKLYVLGLEFKKDDLLGVSEGIIPQPKPKAKPETKVSKPIRAGAWPTPIKVKAHRQNDGYACGAHAVYALLRYHEWDVEYKEIKTELATEYFLPNVPGRKRFQELLAKYGRDDQKGTLTTDICQVLWNYRFTTRVLPTRYEKLKSALIEQVNAGNPALACVKLSPRELHWVLFAGVDGKGIWVADSLEPSRLVHWPKPEVEDCLLAVLSVTPGDALLIPAIARGIQSDLRLFPHLFY